MGALTGSGFGFWEETDLLSKQAHWLGPNTFGGGSSVFFHNPDPDPVDAQICFYDSSELDRVISADYWDAIRRN